MSKKYEDSCTVRHMDRGPSVKEHNVSTYDVPGTIPGPGDTRDIIPVCPQKPYTSAEMKERKPPPEYTDLGKHHLKLTQEFIEATAVKTLNLRESVPIS